VSAGGSVVTPKEEKLTKTTKEENGKKKTSCPAAGAVDEQPTVNGSHSTSSNGALHKRPQFISEDKAVADWMWQLILARWPEHMPPSLESWANTIRLMREQQGRTHEQIRALFERVQSHHFWFKNVLCPEKLRKQWDRLKIEFSEESHANKQFGKRTATSRVGRGDRFDQTQNISWDKLPMALIAHEQEKQTAETEAERVRNPATRRHVPRLARRLARQGQRQIGERGT
jgi:hypothetical protein